MNGELDLYKRIKMFKLKYMLRNNLMSTNDYNYLVDRL